MMRNIFRTAALAVAVLVTMEPALAAGNPCGEISNRLYMLEQVNHHRKAEKTPTLIVGITEAQTLGVYDSDNNDVKCRLKVNWSNGDQQWNLYHEYTNSVGQPIVGFGLDTPERRRERGFPVAGY